jgi:hypothetical protein
MEVHHPCMITVNLYVKNCHLTTRSFTIRYYMHKSKTYFLKDKQGLEQGLAYKPLLHKIGPLNITTITYLNRKKDGQE